MENEIREKKVYFYTDKTNKSIKEYKFWKTPYDTWRIMKTIYDIDSETNTVEMTIPNEVINKMITNMAKESLTDE